MLREIIKVKNTDYLIHIPEEYLDQEVEILVLPLSNNFENDTSRKKIIISDGKMIKSKGIFSQYKNPELIQSEKAAWSEVVREKHADY